MLLSIVVRAVFLIILFYLAVSTLVIVDIPRLFFTNVFPLRFSLIFSFKMSFYTTVKAF